MFLCHFDDIEEDSSKGFQLSEDHLVFAVKKDGCLQVYRNSCPHLGVPLEMQEDVFLDLDKAFIQCSTHGALFEIESGLCVVGPCKGASLQVEAFELKNGEVHIS